MLTASAFFEAPAGDITPQMEREFFSGLMTRNGTWKTTFHDRFADINRFLADRARERLLDVADVLDVGVSSGISTLEMFEDLRAAGCGARIVGTDLQPDAFLVQAAPGARVLVDETGFPLMLEICGHAVRPWVAAADYRNGRLVPRKLANLILSARAKAILRRADHPRIAHVKLVTPRLRDVTPIQIVKDDIRQPNAGFAGRFGFIRIANVMNRSYFAEDVLTGMAKNARNYLAGTGSSMLVIRTHEDGSNHGTLFRLVRDGIFEVDARFGKGSEVEELVLATSSRPQAD